MHNVDYLVLRLGVSNGRVGSILMDLMVFMKS